MSRAANDTLIDLNGQSLDSNWSSEPISLLYLNYYTIQLEFSGVISGTFLLEYTNSEDLNNAVWSYIAGSGQAISEAGDHTWEVREVGFKYVRVVWQHSGGNGTLNFARFNAKGI